jgi:hypothetical protein
LDDWCSCLKKPARFFLAILPALVGYASLAYATARIGREVLLYTVLLKVDRELPAKCLIYGISPDAREYCDEIRRKLDQKL